MLNMLYNSLDIHRIIEMAWEDRTPFEAIRHQFNITEAYTIRLMRLNLKSSSFKRWRMRVHQTISHKHALKRNSKMVRFKCDRQRSISVNKISKRATR